MATRRASLEHVSSEFQTPLTTAKGSLETVLRHWAGLDEDRRRALVKRALRGCEDLVGALGQLQDAEAMEPPGRWKLATLAIDRTSLGTTARVILENDDVTLSGESRLRTGRPSAYDCVVEATLHAVARDMLVRPDGHSADVFEVQGTKLAVVCLFSRESPLVGTAAVRLDEYDAIARATLAALNRMLTRYEGSEASV